MAPFSPCSFLLPAFDYQPLINSIPHQQPPPTHLQAFCTPDTNQSSSRMTIIHDSNETHSPVADTSMAPIKLENPGDKDAVAQTKKKKKKRADCRNGSSSQEVAEGRRNKKQKKGNSNNGVVKQGEKPKVSPEPPKGYIHVRARRGEATDSHSLAERVRREKISERMKILQRLVPGCDKITGKALLLDEIINYIHSLRNQVEFLSMKLASVNPIMFGDLTMGQDTLLMGETERLLNSAVASPLPSLPQCRNNQATNFAADDPTTAFLQGDGRSNVFSNSLDFVDDQLWDVEDQRQNFPNNPNYGFSNTLWSFDCWTSQIYITQTCCGSCLSEREILVQEKPKPRMVSA